MAADHPEAGGVILARATRRCGAARCGCASRPRYAAEHALRERPRPDAESSARLALELVDEGLNMFTGGALEVLVARLRSAARSTRRTSCCATTAGRRVRALPWQISVRHARARLGWPRATSSSRTPTPSKTGPLRAAQGRPNPSLAPWRSTAALALAHLGRRDEAAAVAEAELALAMRFGARCRSPARSMPAPSPTRPRRAVALCERAWRWRHASLDRCGRGSNWVGRWRIWAGARGARSAAPGAAEADEAGAVLLGRARAARAGGDGAAAAPRRGRGRRSADAAPATVCERAAAAKSNREIAQGVPERQDSGERASTAGYRKLGVSTRAGLAAELGAAAA